MDAIERALLNAVQTRFPVESHPYRTLAGLAGTGETEAFERIQSLRREGIIRRLGGVFDSHRLGYYSTLCAAKVPPDKIPVLTDLLAAIPGVTHNYLRNHAYNMWFTLIVSSQTESDRILNQVREESGVADIYSLPAERLFKIKVDFDLSEWAEEENSPESPAPTGVPVIAKPEAAETGAWHPLEMTEYHFSDRDITLIRVLQGDLPGNLTPFAELAGVLDWEEEEVLRRSRQLLEAGVIRRFGAVLRHQKAGFVANAMGVWQVPPEQVIEVGKKMASFREVSHCYQRPPLADWPYNLFTMVHGRTPEDCEQTMERIAQATGISAYNMLFSVAELKKNSMQYFIEEQE